MPRRRRCCHPRTPSSPGRRSRRGPAVADFDPLADHRTESIDVVRLRNRTEALTRMCMGNGLAVPQGFLCASSDLDCEIVSHVIWSVAEAAPAGRENADLRPPAPLSPLMMPADRAVLPGWLDAAASLVRRTAVLSREDAVERHRARRGRGGCDCSCPARVEPERCCARYRRGGARNRTHGARPGAGVASLID